MKKKKNYDITHKVVRVNADDYKFLIDMSAKTGLPVSDVIHEGVIHSIAVELEKRISEDEAKGLRSYEPANLSDDEALRLWEISRKASSSVES
jgi:hypothetical protein